MPAIPGRGRSVTPPESTRQTMGSNCMAGPTDDYVRVMPAAEVAEEEIYEFEVDGELRILTRVGDEIFACDGICTHEYAEMSEGEIEDHVIYCPLHGSGF